VESDVGEIAATRIASDARDLIGATVVHATQIPGAWMNLREDPVSIG